MESPKSTHESQCVAWGIRGTAGHRAPLTAVPADVEIERKPAAPLAPAPLRKYTPIAREGANSTVTDSPGRKKFCPFPLENTQRVRRGDRQPLVRDQAWKVACVESERLIGQRRPIYDRSLIDKVESLREQDLIGADERGIGYRSECQRIGKRADASHAAVRR